MYDRPLKFAIKLLLFLQMRLQT